LKEKNALAEASESVIHGVQADRIK